MALYVADLLLRGLPWAMLQFGQALWGAVTYTMTGHYEPRPKDDARND
jgi:hypothetical protein